MLHGRKVRSEAVEKAHAKFDGENGEAAIDSPAMHKDDLLDDDENEMSENESVGTQPEEVIYSFFLIIYFVVHCIYCLYFRRKTLN